MEVNTNDITLFLYLLMRDHVPVGVVAKIKNEVNLCEQYERTYSNQYLAAYAKSLAEELLEGR
jgi:hypothetical protein